MITLLRRMSIKEWLDRVGDDVVQYDQEADETEAMIEEEAMIDVHQTYMLDTVNIRTNCEEQEVPVGSPLLRRSILIICFYKKLQLIIKELCLFFNYFKVL